MTAPSCREAALLFQTWASLEGLTDDATAPGNLAELRTQIMAQERGVALLRQKRITHIGINDADNSITVYLRLAAPSSDKALEPLPRSVLGYSVIYRQGVAQGVNLPEAQPHAVPPYSLRALPGGRAVIACGSSISVGNSRDAGTLCALVRNPAGEVFGLSNNHVVGSCSHAPVGLPIVFPGIVDVMPNGVDPRTIGHFARPLPMLIGDPTIVPVAQNHDAAIFKISNADLFTSMQGNAYDTPATTLPLRAGMAVEKVGRTTGHTHGTVAAEILGAVPITYNAPIYEFNGRVYFTAFFTVVGTGDVFSSFGDSGSLVTTVDGTGVRRAVGIVVGGMTDRAAPGGSISLILPIETALAGLGVSLVSGHNV